MPGVPRGNRRFSVFHHLTFPPLSAPQMFAQLRNALARNASVFQTARTASTGANGKAWAVDLMASEAGISKKQAEIALKSLLAGIEGAVVNGERVTFQGFGSFESVARAARTGVNPQNPTQKINIPASIAPKFKAGSAFKSAVNK